MRGALLIAKKEFLELSKDRKTMFFAFVLPFLLYPAIFGMMAKMGKRDEAQNRNKASRVYVSDPSRILDPVLGSDPRLFERVARPEGDLRQAIRDQKLELALEVAATAATSLQKQETFTLTAIMDESERASELALKRLRDAVKAQEKAWVQGRLQSLGASAQLAEPLKLEVKDAADTTLKAGKAQGGNGGSQNTGTCGGGGLGAGGAILVEGTLNLV